MKLSKELTAILNRNCMEQFGLAYTQNNISAIKSLTLTIYELKHSNELNLFPNLTEILVCLSIESNEFVRLKIPVEGKLLKIKTIIKNRNKIIHILN